MKKLLQSNGEPKITIIPFPQKYLEEMARLYLRVYSTKELKINLRMAMWTIEYCVRLSPETCLAAVQGERCIGAVFCCRDMSYLDKVYYLESVQVDEGSQDKGVGTLLVRELLKIAKKRKISRIFLDVDGKNRKLLEWYPKFGFETVNRVIFQKDLK